MTMLDEPFAKTVVQPRRWTTAPGVKPVCRLLALFLAHMLTNQWRRQNRNKQQLGRRHFPEVPLLRRHFESAEFDVKNVFFFLLNYSKPTKEQAGV